MATEPLRLAIEELAALAKVRIARRTAARGSYRRFQVVAANIPRPYRPPSDSPIATYLSTMYPSTSVDRRVVVLAVQLIPTVKATGGVRQVVRNVSDFILEQAIPMAAFDEDADLVATALARCGLTTPADDEWAVIDAWWNGGDEPGVTLLQHPDHLHVFTSPDSARAAAAAGNESDCERWPESMAHYPLALGSVAGFDFPPGTDETSSSAHWVSRLFDAGAVAVSVKGLVEPASVTRHELRRRRTEYEHDIQERVASGKMDRAEQEEMVSILGDTEQEYAIGGPATLTDCSITVAIPGRDQNTGYSLTEIGRQCGVTLWTIQHSQVQALSEMFLGSNVRANPYMHDLPVQTLSASGITSIARVGDTSGALIGFSQRDRQPAYLSPTAASAGDSLPMMLVAGATGSGKSVAMLWMADQFSRIPNAYGERTPVVILDPKAGSDHSAAVGASGGQVYSLDDLTKADGVFDPIRFARRSETGVELAASVLRVVNPWGDQRDNMEVPLTKALHWGVTNGATCTGQALLMAREYNGAPPALVDPVIDLAQSSPMFRSIVGLHQESPALRVAQGITLIKVGEGYFNLPAPGAEPEGQQQRIALSLVRMAVFGSAMAVSGRAGVVMLDEAWIFLGAGRNQVEELGRVARSQQVLPILFTQRVTDALKAELTGYISRGLILPIEDPDEARAACMLFRLDPTPERIERITARKTIGDALTGGAAPNWASMHALRDPQTGRVLRGTIAIYADLVGRQIPVEISIPPAFLARSSTNPEDIRARQEAERLTAQRA